MKNTKIGVLAIFLMFCVAGPLMAQNEEQLAGVELQAMADTFQDALENNPTNTSSDWVNPDTTRSGAVVPTRTFENAQRQPCREFITTIIIAGQEEQGYGTACRQPDGSWQLDNEATASAPPPPQVRTTTHSYIERYPTAYYAYPNGFFGQYRIYLSFGHVYRSGRLHVGSHYMDGRSFRSRNRVEVRHHVYRGPQIFNRYRINDELKYRDWDRHNRDKYKNLYKREKKARKDWRENSRHDGDRKRRDRHDD